MRTTVNSCAKYYALKHAPAELIENRLSLSSKQQMQRPSISI